MHSSRRKHEAEAGAGVPRGPSSGSDSELARAVRLEGASRSAKCRGYTRTRYI